MLERYLGSEGVSSTIWNDLGSGAPTLIALAELCSQAITTGKTDTSPLSPEAKAILYIARHRGILEVKGSNSAYESPCRMLTVFVEVDNHSQIRLRHSSDARQNVQFLEGFRQLCANGLLIHHLYHEFSLTSVGFDVAETLSPHGLEELLELGQRCTNS
ncbi:MAG: hypothetical protein ACODAD_09440 [Planctomycetota bacterium]